MAYFQIPNSINKETCLCETHLRILLTTNGIVIDGDWSKEKFLAVLKCKLMQHHKMKCVPAPTEMQRDALLKPLHSLIHSGVYSECILLELEKNGMPLHNIMKVIKYGLHNLSTKELKYFRDSGVVKNTDTWMEELDEKLISNLAVIGLTEEQCWAIVTHGVACQDESVLYRLLTSGIDIPGILNWPPQDKLIIEPMIIEFLRYLGIDEDVVQYAESSGIDDEIKDMLTDLGYDEYVKQKEKPTEEILCECDLIILERDYALSREKLQDDDVLCVAACTCVCICNLLEKEDSKNNETLERSNYLRQNIMVPLSWAVGKALKYRPTDPNYYISYQLLRWKYNVSRREIDEVKRLVTSATVMMDRLRKIQRKNKEALQNIPCDVCLNRQKLERIKKRCWKCTRVPTSV